MPAGLCRSAFSGQRPAGRMSHMDVHVEFAPDPGLEKLRLGLVILEGLEWSRGTEVVPEPLREEILAGAAAWPPDILERKKRAVRDMLRNGCYKPAGRAKPSSEYLLSAALEGDFPRVNPFVDAVNLASLRYQLPMSIFDLDRALGGPAGSGVRSLLCRLGRTGESYVFNAGGQSIDLEDLVCVCGYPEGSEEPRPIVNPVRDSMATKLFEGGRNAAIVIYAPAGAEAWGLDEAMKDLAAWCGRACGQVSLAGPMAPSLP